MTIFEKARRILEQPVCDHCLGRQFAQLLSGYTNVQRGKLFRTIVAMSLDKEKLSETDQKLELSNFADYKFHILELKQKLKSKKCSICQDIFTKLDSLAQKAVKKAKGWEYRTFLVGTKLSAALLNAEEHLWERVGIDWCEPIKAELNREIGKRIEHLTGARFDPKIPDMVFVINLERKSVSVQPNPLFIYGEYQKLVRGIPQTKWPSGKYRTSVEEIVAKPFMTATKGIGHRFHGCGREDISARCLAWRPFVLEIQKPKVRTLNLKRIAKKIDKRVKVRALRLSNTIEVQKIKEARPDKSYRAIVTCEQPINAQELKKLQQLVGTIKQRTPLRVLHRRADRVRQKKVKQLKTKLLGKNIFELVVRCEAGLYVKELISGDKGRTRPSVSEILGKPCTCTELDVIKIHR
jgi:tRNA pseudouridine synthase 10